MAVPFQTPLRRAIHFQRHGHEFGAKDEFEYERMADAFMMRVPSATMQQCFRPAGRDRLRIDHSLRHFGSASVKPEYLHTFHVVDDDKIRRFGRTIEYFRWECARKFD
jgi:hypothetical protein